MFSLIKTIVLKLKYGYKSSSGSYIKYLKKMGVKIGENTNFYSPWTIAVDTSRPWMLEIGDNVNITAGVSILTHGYDWCVFKGGITKKVYGSAGSVKIGNNVFIGQKSILLKGVTIGDNVIIGAGSIVTHDIPPNSVAVGSPARVISGIEDYEKKRSNLQLQEAEQIFLEYYNRYKRYPDKKVFDEFFYLFTNKKEDLWDKAIMQMSNCGNFDESLKIFLEHEPMFNSFEKFSEYCIKKIDEKGE